MKSYSVLILFLIFALGFMTRYSFSDPIELNSQTNQKIEKLYSEFQHLFPAIQTINADEVNKRNPVEKAVIVDVRTPAERKVSFIPGSISQTEFEKNNTKYKGFKIIAYCTIGYRSAQFAQTITTLGFEVYNLKGGILSWVNSGLPIVDANGPTRKVHVYGRKWNLIPKSYEAIW